MIEDDFYRTSTQYRLWSFTQESLKSLRVNTNALASERVKAALKRLHQREGNGEVAHDEPQAGGDAVQEKNIDCLTVEEELKLVRYYCESLFLLAEEYKPPLPTTVRATAIQYLRRFYLSNSPMTYHPKQVMPCALFLATKTESHHISARAFAEQVPKTTPEDILAPEFLLTQGLRFTFDIRHPFRGLEGGIMELLALAEGNGPTITPDQSRSPKELKEELLQIKHLDAKVQNDIKQRIGLAHQGAKDVLKAAALMTDAYFLYTPSQIWLAALFMSDEPIAQFYLGIRVPLDSHTKNGASADLRNRLLATIKDCVTLLRSYVPGSQQEMKDLKRIGKKLYQCQNPEKMDLVELNKAQKREGATDSDAEKTSKKRKLERAQLEKDGDVFGRELNR